MGHTLWTWCSSLGGSALQGSASGRDSTVGEGEIVEVGATEGSPPRLDWTIEAAVTAGDNDLSALGFWPWWRSQAGSGPDRRARRTDRPDRHGGVPGAGAAAGARVGGEPAAGGRDRPSARRSWRWRSCRARLDPQGRSRWSPPAGSGRVCVHGPAHCVVGPGLRHPLHRLLPGWPAAAASGSQDRLRHVPAGRRRPAGPGSTRRAPSPRSWRRSSPWRSGRASGAPWWSRRDPPRCWAWRRSSPTSRCR